MSRGYKTAVFAVVAFLGAAGLYAYAPAALTSADYTILTNELTSVGNSSAKLGGPYSLYGNTSQLGHVSLSGFGWSVTWGALNVVRPAQDDVFSVYVRPNPCNIRAGCNGVKFERMSLNATIYIYTISGELVCTIKKSGGDAQVGWDLRNNAGSRVASGLYIYFIKAETSVKKGKIVIIR